MCRCFAVHLGLPVHAANFSVEVEQITDGPHHHFFGYIGQSLTSPWNASGRYLLTLRTTFHNRPPTASDAAEICLVDTTSAYAVVPIEQTRGWNFQQGTMIYWHPKHPETQFFFNDRDVTTNRILTSFTISKRNVGSGSIDSTAFRLQTEASHRQVNSSWQSITPEWLASVQ